MRVLIVSDIHANLGALEAVLTAAGDVDEVWNLGDTVGYGPSPGECLDRMQGFPNAITLSGNHDLAAIGGIDVSSFNDAARIAAVWTGTRLTESQRAYLESLPSRIEHGDVTLAHGSPRSPVWEYVTTDRIATENFAHFDSHVCLIGHSHVACFAKLAADAASAEMKLLADGQVIDLSADRWIINPGSVGQPRDRDPRAACAILDTDQATLSAIRVPYNVAATQQQMAVAGLPESLIRRLPNGM